MSETTAAFGFGFVLGALIVLSICFAIMILLGYRSLRKNDAKNDAKNGTERNGTE